MKENSQIAFDFFTPPTRKPATQVPGDSQPVDQPGEPSEKITSNEPVTEVKAAPPEEQPNIPVAEEIVDNLEITALDEIIDNQEITASDVRVDNLESSSGEHPEDSGHLELNTGNNLTGSENKTGEEPIDLGYISFTTTSRTAPAAKTRGRKSLKSYDSAAAFTEVPPDDILFSKQYYPIGEVAQMFNVNASLLRYWESEFDILKPRKNKKGDRHFRPEDIKNLELIYDLLRRRKLTIDGARNFLKKNKSAKERYEMIRSLQDMRSFLFELKASL